jgi:hypothetical protein
VLRFALAVLAAAIASALVFNQPPDWFLARGAFVAFAYLLFAAFGAGWFAARYSAVAGGLSVLLGAAAVTVLRVLTAPPLEVASVGALELILWGLRFVGWALPYAIGGAFAGAAGGWLRGRVLRRA